VTVRRIVSNIAASDIRAGKRFYQDVLGLELLMDHGCGMRRRGNA
jgi:catechol 2,3-dioxygenase-like lactoylglutathione lyase family enzyme